MTAVVSQESPFTVFSPLPGPYVRQMKILETTVSEQNWVHLTIIPSARMGSESIAHEAESRMGY